MYQITATARSPPVGASLGVWFATFSSDADVAGDGHLRPAALPGRLRPDHFIEAGRVRAAAEHRRDPGRSPSRRPEPSCSDANKCTTDQCVNGLVCDNDVRPNGSQCTNGDQCSGIGTCQDGACNVEAALNCNDNNACTVDSCDASKGGCQYADLNCIDGDPCTNDLCDPLEGCLHVAKESFEGLECRADNVQKPANDKKITRALSRALNLVNSAKGKPPRGAARRPQKGGHHPQVRGGEDRDGEEHLRERCAVAVAAITNLVNQIRAVVSELEAQLGKGGAK
jgi:hypothetical protein